MFRPQIKVLDCTIRDGGLANDSHFSMETVREVYKAACDAGIDYVELGYRNSKEMFSPEEFGPWRFCDEGNLRQAVEGIESNGTKVAVMQDAHKAIAEDILPADESVVDLIRIATYVKDIDKAIHLAQNATEKGYECTINIMAISHEGYPFLDEALQQIEEETSVIAVYIVDSFGALYSEEVDALIEKYRKYLKNKEIGAHFHNNRQLAFANTIEAIIKGANFLDGTLFGLGRAAGNCPLELLMSFLKNPKFDIEPVLKVISETIMPLGDSIDWGYHIPYMITGMLDEHPRTAMAFMKNGDNNDYVGFYRQFLDDLTD
ncbi:MAG: aldolase catalytic domain-containing protein [Planctomycetota bacterium]|nr:aldolase catalytic domain-containing protein [Planctomycetota bacterium]